MFGWSISASACRSASKRAITCRVSMPGLMILSATRRLDRLGLLGHDRRRPCPLRRSAAAACRGRSACRGVRRRLVDRCAPAAVASSRKRAELLVSMRASRSTRAAQVGIAAAGWSMKSARSPASAARSLRGRWPGLVVGVLMRSCSSHRGGSERQCDDRRPFYHRRRENRENSRSRRRLESAGSSSSPCSQARA